MTRLEIRTLIRKKLGETTGAFWSDTELNTWINFACKDAAFKTKCLRTNGLLNTITDTQEYVLSTAFPGILSILEVEYYQDGTSWEKITATSREELNAIHSAWKNVSAGTPQQYYYDREEDVIGLYPKPDADNDGAYCRAYYTYDHTDLTTDTSSPTLPTQLHLAVVDWVSATGFDTRGYQDKANDSWGKYYGKIKEYMVERHREKEDEEIIMKNFRNI
jgi:hypothetical protein